MVGSGGQSLESALVFEVATAEIDAGNKLKKTNGYWCADIIAISIACS
jgi:hypothetical protein